MLKKILIVTLFFCAQPSFGQNSPFYETKYWQDLYFDIGQPSKIFALSTSNPCVANSRVQRIILIVFNKGNSWYSMKVFVYKKKQILSVPCLVSLSNVEFITNNIHTLKNEIQKIQIQDRYNIPGFYTEIYYSEEGIDYEIPYFDAPGRGDLNGLVNSFPIIFSLSSIINNNCF